MSPNVASWVHSTQPGMPPPPPTVRSYSPAPSSISPHSSVSNPDASRYRRVRAQSISSSQYSSSYQSQSRQPRSPTRYSQSRALPSRAYTVDSAGQGHFSPARSMSGSRISGSSRGTYVQADGHLPVVARTTKSDGRTGSWVIIPPEGESVEVVSPQRPATSMGNYTYSASRVSSPARSNSAASHRNLLQKVFDKVEWGNKSTASLSSRHSSSSRHSRRNSTGGSHSGSWTVLSGGSAARSGVSVSTVRAGGRTMDIIRV